MDREELAARLEDEAIPVGWYHLYGAHFDGRHVIDHRAAGWFVFFTERGDEWDVRRFETEAGACAELYSRLQREADSGRDQ